MLRLIQIPFSHNCIKVRCALTLKGLPYETLDIRPMDRKPVVASSGQGLVPVLEDGAARIFDSSAILQHLETTYPEVPLLPEGEARRAECWLIEDWADGAFMNLSRRLAYWELIRTPDAIARLWFPEVGGLRRRFMTAASHRILRKRFHLSEKKNAADEAETPRLAALALGRLAGKPGFFGDRPTVADIALAAMTAPLVAATAPVRNDPVVRDLLAWGNTVLGPALSATYLNGP